MSDKSATKRRSLSVVGCFAGVGGIELGLRRHGHESVVLSELEPTAQAVLRRRFPGTSMAGDIRSVKMLPPCDLIAAGFPCQDLSQCGKTAGVRGADSSLVKEIFRLIEGAKHRPNWVLLENVPFMLRLDSGRAIRLITDELVRLGYRWAYRTVNARAFGVPQRRLRVVVVASLDSDPREVLFADEAEEPLAEEESTACGFYWTEGNSGLGWAPDCVPTLKGGSTIGIPSPPAIWIPAEKRIVTIDLRDAERLQGFPVDWTKPAVEVSTRSGARWRLVGNAVCVPMSAWVGRRLASPGAVVCPEGKAILKRGKWPEAAYGDADGSREVVASNWPVNRKQTPILEFLRYPTRSLSERATAGFLSRARKSKLRFDPRFLEDVAFHLDACRDLIEV